jgi:hypothetical protein
MLRNLLLLPPLFEAILVSSVVVLRVTTPRCGFVWSFVCCLETATTAAAAVRVSFGGFFLNTNLTCKKHRFISKPYTLP